MFITARLPRPEGDDQQHRAARGGRPFGNAGRPTDPGTPDSPARAGKRVRNDEHVGVQERTENAA
jgi:hypothetical protein